MKKIILLTLIIFASSVIVHAQTFGYVNTENILEKIPEYTKVQQQIDILKKQYEAKVDAEMKVVESMYNQYQSEKLSLLDVQKEKRENEIISRERAAKDMQRSYFGQDGTLANQTKELLDPIKNRVQSAIEEVAQKAGIILVFDIATSQGIIYNNPAYDLTPKVLQRLNITQ